LNSGCPVYSSVTKLTELPSVTHKEQKGVQNCRLGYICTFLPSLLLPLTSLLKLPNGPATELKAQVLPTK